jgi:5-(carboxyamino)imidazole ribonucleotide synthase
MIFPDAMLGMLGGGQLGRMFALAAHAMGYRVTVLDPDPLSPAGAVADVHLRAAYQDRDALSQLAETCAAVTTEFENVPAESLRWLAAHCTVRPHATGVAVAQDRIREKRFLAAHGFGTAPFAPIERERDLEGCEGLLPGLLKRARFGYDGKGQIGVAVLEEARRAFAELGSEPCVLERRLALRCEVSAVVARAASGETRVFPLAENRHRHGILDVSIVPARIGPALARQAEEAACAIAAALDYSGVLAVEFFVTEEERLLVNEIAPRPHNSGHYTIDACTTSQFEQQVRALCGLPLGDARMLVPAAVMVNLLGEVWARGQPAWDRLLAVPGAKLHLYGKHEARPGRKMGHYTVLGESVEAALERALAIRAALCPEFELAPA